MTKKLVYYSLLTIGISLIIHLINFMASGFSFDFLVQWKYILYNYVYALTIGVANILFFGLLNSRFSWDKEAKKLIIYGVVGSVAVSTLSFFLARVIHKIGIDGYTYEKFIEVEHVQNYIFSMLIAFIITLIFHLFYFYKALQESKIKEQKIISKESSARLQALKDQLDPHFLFNSLNVLTSLIEENPENAQDFTTGLSKIYRYVLEQKEKEKISLKEEISFAKTYINLLKMRFEDSIHFKIELSCDQGYYLIPLSLQLVLENAIKHNRISASNPLHIGIFIEEDMLLIENTYQPKKQTSDRKGVGLANIEERYSLFTDKKIKIEYKDDKFQIYLPLLKNN